MFSRYWKTRELKDRVFRSAIVRPSYQNSIEQFSFNLFSSQDLRRSCLSRNGLIDRAAIINHFPGYFYTLEYAREKKRLILAVIPRGITKLTMIHTMICTRAATLLLNFGWLQPFYSSRVGDISADIISRKRSHDPDSDILQHKGFSPRKSEIECT